MALTASVIFAPGFSSAASERCPSVRRNSSKPGSLRGQDAVDVDFDVFVVIDDEAADSAGSRSGMRELRGAARCRRCSSGAERPRRACLRCRSRRGLPSNRLASNSASSSLRRAFRSCNASDRLVLRSRHDDRQLSAAPAAAPSWPTLACRRPAHFFHIAGSVSILMKTPPTTGRACMPSLWMLSVTYESTNGDRGGGVVQVIVDRAK